MSGCTQHLPLRITNNYIVYSGPYHRVFFNRKVSLLYEAFFIAPWLPVETNYPSHCALMTACLHGLHDLVYNDTWLFHPAVSQPFTSRTQLCIPRTEPLWLLHKHLWNEQPLSFFLLYVKDPDFSGPKISVILLGPWKSLTLGLPRLLAKKLIPILFTKPII